jgi:Glucose-6-phosphate dehydrogenase, C-terminal domain
MAPPSRWRKPPISRQNAEQQQAPTGTTAYSQSGNPGSNPGSGALGFAGTFAAYAHLIQEMLKRDPMLFIRGDEAEQAWRIIDPVMAAWAAGSLCQRRRVHA